MTLRVTLHAYQSDPLLRQRDGVNICHSEISDFMQNLHHPELKVNFHDFSRLCRDQSYARSVLSSTDCVLSNVGPYAHYYHFLREKFDLEFRIIRDTKTALWSSYLLQEVLCQPYLRDDDALITPSRYSRALSRHIFPHLRNHPIFIFEPMMNGCQSSNNKTTKSSMGNRPVTLGYVGRLSEDKNFPQLVELLILLHQQRCGHYRLLACGDVHSLPIRLVPKTTTCRVHPFS